MPAVQIACPECKSFNTGVVSTHRLDDDTLIRRRQCHACDARWYTHQQPEKAISKYCLQWNANGKISGLKQPLEPAI